jgi:serine protease Do
MDTPINGGNSGGALLNGRGELIGIPTMKIDMTYYGRSIEGMAFAIPVNMVKDVTAALIEYGKVPRPRLGVELVDFAGPQEPLALYPPAGVQVLSVEAGTPAEEAGVLKFDIITHVNGVRVTNATQMNTHVDRYMAGDTVTLTVYRCYHPISVQLMDAQQRQWMDLSVELALID